MTRAIPEAADKISRLRQVLLPISSYNDVGRQRPGFSTSQCTSSHLGREEQLLAANWTSCTYGKSPLSDIALQCLQVMARLLQWECIEIPQIWNLTQLSETQGGRCGGPSTASRKYFAVYWADQQSSMIESCRCKCQIHLCLNSRACRQNL